MQTHHKEAKGGPRRWRSAFASRHYRCLVSSTRAPSTIEAATHWESPKQDWREDAPFGRDTKMISPRTAPSSLRPSPVQTLRYPTADYPSYSRAPLGACRKDCFPLGWWDVGAASKEQMKDLYLSPMYIVSPFLSVSRMMLVEGAEVTGARINSGFSFYNNGNREGDHVTLGGKAGRWKGDAFSKNHKCFIPAQSTFFK